MSAVKVLLVDDEQLVLDGMCSLLEGFQEFEVVSAVSDGEAALRCLRVDHPHLVVTGLGGAGMGIANAVRAIRRGSPHVRIVVVTSRQQAVFVREAFLAGASAYLSRRISREELRQTLLTVHREGAALSGETAGLVLQFASEARLGGDGSPLAGLTGRERQVLSLVADDHDTGRIASQMGISPKTVRNYLSRIYAKLGTSNLVQTALYAKGSLGSPVRLEGLSLET
ncbi:DNA-binding response regulator [Streptomyces triticagri]|uniref:DNA-binding response regulator n=1 Tax=Streptomyces triticagri TaxID=2293568 RepID=A0A372M2F3_9ACTN|nr:response regulator transcription factor [Streptomyces triticagri]RFU84705.1 DNA-binding response regulator [Streptomyces triticagri]